MNMLQSHGENYYKVEKIQEFIEQCNRENAVILSVEFFQISDKKVVPYSKLQSIDSTELYDEKKSIEENTSVCNSFIESCISKCFKDLVDLYFNATIEF